jgi:uncharacterized membrane protein YozB (DUF420 family)
MGKYCSFMGFLGTEASFQADLNLILQIVIVILLITGYMLARRKVLFNHGKIMLISVILNAVAILRVMGPSLLLGAGSIITAPLKPTSMIGVIIHPILGGTAELTGIYLVYSWKLDKNVTICYKRKKYMKPTILLWLFAAITGILFYILFYTFHL